VRVAGCPEPLGAPRRLRPRGSCIGASPCSKDRRPPCRTRGWSRFAIGPTSAPTLFRPSLSQERRWRSSPEPTRGHGLVSAASEWAHPARIDSKWRCPTAPIAAKAMAAPRQRESSGAARAPVDRTSVPRNPERSTNPAARLSYEALGFPARRDGHALPACLSAPRTPGFVCRRVGLRRRFPNARPNKHLHKALAP